MLDNKRLFTVRAGVVGYLPASRESEVGARRGARRAQLTKNASELNSPVAPRGQTAPVKIAA